MRAYFLAVSVMLAVISFGRESSGAEADIRRPCSPCGSGPTTLKLQGNVLQKYNHKTKKRTQFTLGPVDLREAANSSPDLTGTVSLHVDQRGKATMTNFRINKEPVTRRFKRSILSLIRKSISDSQLLDTKRKLALNE